MPQPQMLRPGSMPRTRGALSGAVFGKNAFGEVRVRINTLDVLEVLEALEHAQGLDGIVVAKRDHRRRNAVDLARRWLDPRILERLAHAFHVFRPGIDRKLAVLYLEV